MRRFAVIAFSFATALLACQIVAGIERVEKVDPVAAETSTPDNYVPPEIPDPCTHVMPPGAPIAEDPGDDLPDFVLAARSLSLLPPDGGAFPGYDLDGVCTCDTREGTAEGGASSCTRAGKSCDLEGGLDNVGAQLIKSLAFTTDVNNAANITPRIDNGRQTLLLVISQYNGKANDKEVKFGLVPSDGIREPDASKRCPGSVEDPLGGHYSPGWCGSDPWTVIPGAVIPAGTPLGFNPITTGTGYVTNYELVVRLQLGTVKLPFGNTGLELGSPIAVLGLEPLGEDLMPRDKSRAPTEREKRLWRVSRGTLAGRIPSSDLLAASGTIPVPDSGGQDHLCRSSLFGVLKSTVCGSLDIARTTAFDFVPDRACDALSMAVLFSAEPAIWSGQIFEDVDPGNECSPAADNRPADAGVDVLYRCDPSQ